MTLPSSCRRYPPARRFSTFRGKEEEKEKEKEEEEEEDGGERALLIAVATPPPTEPVPALASTADDAALLALASTICGVAPVAAKVHRPEGAAAAAAAAELEFPSERAARDAAAALAADPAFAGAAIETLRRALWPDEEPLADPASASVYVAGVPSQIGPESVRQIFATYGACVGVDAGLGGEKNLTRVTMATREGAETAAAALSGVYKFDETQEAPVTVYRCDPERGGGGTPSSSSSRAAVAVGEKRKPEEDGAASAAGGGAGGSFSSHQLLAVGLPADATEASVAALFDGGGDGAAAAAGASVVVGARVLPDRRAAFVCFADPSACAAALETASGLTRPAGSAVPVTFVRVSAALEDRPKKRRRLATGGAATGAGSGPGGIPGWPAVPKPGPQYGDPSPKIYVGSIPSQYDEETVRRIFETVGPTREVKILRQADGRHKGSGFVTYDDVEAANRAIHFIDNRYSLIAPNFPSQKPIYMKFASVGGGRGRGGAMGAGAGNAAAAAYGAAGGGVAAYGAYGGAPMGGQQGGYGMGMAAQAQYHHAQAAAAAAAHSQYYAQYYAGQQQQQQQQQQHAHQYQQYQQYAQQQGGYAGQHAQYQQPAQYAQQPGAYAQQQPGAYQGGGAYEYPPPQ